MSKLINIQRFRFTQNDMLLFSELKTNRVNISSFVRNASVFFFIVQNGHFIFSFRLFSASISFGISRSIFSLIGKFIIMAERQKHGFNYQSMIVKSDLIVEDESYTGKWDAFSAEYNLPISVKCIGVRGSIDFGDFRRQSLVDTDFLLYIGFWKGDKDNIVEEYKIHIKKENWVKYFGNTSIISDMMLEMKDISNDHNDDHIILRESKPLNMC